MLRELPLYDIVIDLDDPETTVSFNSLVANPAHEKSFETFSKKVAYQFNDEEQVITGVAISANTPIFRRDPRSGEEFYVNFSPAAIKDIVFDYARRDNFNNVNIEHDKKRVVDGIYMIMSYVIDESKGFTAPERFKDENDGSWIVSYKVTNKDVYEAAKTGMFKGFSIEGVFQLLETGKGWEHEFATIYQELKQVQEYITFYNDYPEAVSNNAKKGIELNKKYGNKCATRVGRLRATTLANRQTVSVAVIKRMYSYLSRAEEYYDESDQSACGTISYLLWGGLAAKRWSEAKLKELGQFSAMAIDDQNVNVFGYHTRYFQICPGAQSLFRHLTTMEVDEDTKGMIRSAAQAADNVFRIESEVLQKKQATMHEYEEAAILIDDMEDIMEQVDEIVDMDHDISFMENHLDKIEQYLNEEMSSYDYPSERKKKKKKEKEIGYAEVGPRGGIRESPKAPKSDTPNKDPKGEGTAKGDASGKRGAEVTAEQEKTLQKKVDDFNEKDSNTKNGRATLGALKSVFQRGLGAYNTSHSPNVKSAEQWGYARVNAFLYLLKNGRPQNPKYTTDYDLLPKDHPKSEK